MSTKNVTQSIQLIQWYYHFLLLGKFLEVVMQHNDLSSYAQKISISTGLQSNFTLNEKKIKSLLGSIYKHADKKNFYGYLVEISAFKGMYSVMRELIEESPAFTAFLERILKDQYFMFDQLMRLLRNILTHSSSSQVIIQKEFTDKQVEFLRSKKYKVIEFDFLYSRFVSQWKWAADYGFSLRVDLNRLDDGVSLFDVVSVHHLYLLAELCYNLVEIFKKTVIEKDVKSKNSGLKSRQLVSKTLWKTSWNQRRKRK